MTLPTETSPRYNAAAIGAQPDGLSVMPNTTPCWAWGRALRRRVRRQSRTIDGVV